MRVYFSVLLVLLAMGCSSQPSKEAPIESITGTATPNAAPNAKPVAKPAATPIKDKGPAPATKAVEGGAAVTKPLPSSGVQVKPLDAPAGSGANAVAPVPADAAKSGVVAVLARPKQRVFLFSYDSAVLAPDSHQVLDAHGEYLKANKKAEMLVQGHADERGSREYNLALGQRRAESVKQALVLLGVPDTQLEAVSLGAEKPTSDGNDEASWMKNRRSVLIYKDE